VKKLYSDIDSRRSRVVVRSITRKKGGKISLKQFEVVSVFGFFSDKRREEWHYLVDCICVLHYGKLVGLPGMRRSESEVIPM
jgi:hypothetical protein